MLRIPTSVTNGRVPMLLRQGIEVAPGIGEGIRCRRLSVGKRGVSILADDATIPY